ncbi:MAG: hypothetical protein ABSB68_01400 [Acidimicrobiales bacterium]|jgi:hypothetical protein
MSMYTQLLEAAFGQRPTPGAGATEQDAHEEVIRCRRELQKGVPLGTDPDTVPVTLALQIGYDVALLDLAKVVGIDTDPDHFEQPQLERERIEGALGELGFSFVMATETEEPLPGRT